MTDFIDIELLDPLYRDVFRDPANGTVGNISKAGCLALAALGKEAWNAWRIAFPAYKNLADDWVNTVNFSGHDFRTVEVDFSSFNFGAHANFSGAVFPRNVNFSEAIFGIEASFTGTQFASRVSFNRCYFDCDARFNGTQFSNEASFRGAVFETGVRFVGRAWEQLSKYYSERKGKVEQAKKWADKRGLSPSSFKSIYFNGAQFKGRVNFSDRSFLGQTSFGKDEFGNKASFKVAPKFHNCKLHQDTSLNEAIFPMPDGSGSAIAARAYRTLKLAFSGQQAIREEQRFFLHEMAEEAAMTIGSRRYLYKAYSLFSQYGFSITRPIVLFAVTLLAMMLIYGVLSYLNNCLPNANNCRFSTAWVEFSLLQSLPLPGLDKLSDTLRGQLFPTEGLISIAVTVAVILHKAISLLALFLMGLALRNLFKLK
jgi:uncharacterized protein YjbI with pentapeptide repeats